MNFWNLAVLGLSFFAPAAAFFFVALRDSRLSAHQIKACAALLGLAMIAAALGVARINEPIRMELLWPLTLEQSGYFEFSLQLVWSRFIWVFFSAALLLGYSIYDEALTEPGSGLRARLLFLTGSFFFSTLACLCENVVLSLMFLEVSAFLLHAFGLEPRGSEEALEKSSYFKRSCFVFLALLAMLAIAASHQLSTGSVLILGAVLYLCSILMSKNNPAKWSELPLLLLQFGFALFILERVLLEDSPSELWIPLSAVCALGTVSFAAVSLLTPGSLGASFWMLLTMLSYLLYLRFSSGRPVDSFWGAYEAVGLGAAYCIANFMRFGQRLDLLWKRAIAFLLLVLILGIVSGALPSVELSATRFDSETSIVRVALLSILTFLVSLISAKGLAVSFGGKSGESSQKALLAALAPAILLLVAQVGLIAKWSDVNFEDFAAAGLSAMLYDTRVFITSAAVASGVLAGGLLGTNSGFGGWIKSRDFRMEHLFPTVDPAILSRFLELIRVPERFIRWLNARVSIVGGNASGALESVDRRFFGERFFRGFSGYSDSLSRFARFFHSGQMRAYLFLGVLISLFSSLVFLLEGR